MKRPTKAWREGGQAMVLFAIMLPALIGTIALTMDLGYGYVERRDLQNAADLSAIAAANYIGNTSGPQDAQVVKILKDIVPANAALKNIQWTAVYWDTTKNNNQGGQTGTVGAGGSVPGNADGVKVFPTVQSGTFFAQILGFTMLNVSASGGAVPSINSNTSGPPIGGGRAPAIVSLDAGSHIYPHNIISDANGTFDITSGGIVADGCYGSWNAAGTKCSDNGSYTDVVDVKDGSKMNIAGKFITTSPSPFDSHFTGSGSYVGGTDAVANYGGGTVTKMTYAGGKQTGAQYYADPLRWLAEPQAADTACPGSSVYSAANDSYGGITLQPGVYSSVSGKPVIFSGNVTLQDCGSNVPGIYIFPQGAIFGGAVTGNDVMLYSQGGYADTAKLVCTDSNQPENGGAVTNEPQVGSTSGLTDYGFIFTGSGGVNLTAPNSGRYHNLLLFQSRDVPGHIGFSICPGDGAAVNLTGTIYAHNKHDVPNDPANVMTVTNTPWSPAGAGSGLVFGTDDNSQEGQGNPTPTFGGGTLNLDGAAVVDIFYTTGTANVQIQYDINHVPEDGTQLIQ